MIPYLFFIYKYRKIFSQLNRLNVKKLSNSFNWTKDLLPLQIKIAISALSSFFAISTMTPMTFVFYGAEEAGRMGLSLTILLAVIGLTTVLVSVNFHKFGVLASNKDIKAMDKLVMRLTLIVLILSTLLIISILISFYFVESLFPDILTRLMPMSSFIYFAIGMIFSSLGAPMGAYLRAHKIDPIMKISLISSIVVLISNYIALEYFSIQTLPIFYAIVVSSAFPFVVIFYFIHRRNYYKREINF
jgi:O-antigen/teichoic acid export membrane protein